MRAVTVRVGKDLPAGIALHRADGKIGVLREMDGPAVGQQFIGRHAFFLIKFLHFGEVRRGFQIYMPDAFPGVVHIHQVLFKDDRQTQFRPVGEFDGQRTGMIIQPGQTRGHTRFECHFETADRKPPGDIPFLPAIRPVEQGIEAAVAAVFRGVCGEDRIAVALVDQLAETVVPQIALVHSQVQGVLSPDQHAEISVGQRHAAVRPFHRERECNEIPVFLHIYCSFLTGWRTADIAPLRIIS